MNVIDIREANRFLDILNPDKSNLIFQTFDDSTKKDPVYITTRTGKLDTYVDKLTSLNEKGAGIFVTVNRSKSNRRIKNDIILCRAIWQEDDIGTDKIPELAPSVVIETSAGKFHRYWLIKDGTENIKQWEQVQQKLVDDWDSDPNVKDTCRVMRIPGFYHNKKEPFQVKIVSDITDVKYYEWQEIVAYFMPEGIKKKQSDYVEKEDKFDPVKTIEDVLNAENFHGALQSLAGRYANMDMGKNEVTMMLKALIMSSKSADADRRERAFNEVEAQVDWAFKETAKENYVHPDLDNGVVEEEGKRDEYLDLPMPDGNIGIIATNVMEFMRYPSKEIAIETALHCINTFGASSYNFDGVPNHRKTVLLAGQGRGKNVVNTYIERVCTAMCHGNMSNPMYLEFLGNGDYTSPKQMHLELQEFGSRSMISSEAGHAQATKAGDRVGLKGYENQLLMTAPESLVTPPRRQNSVKGELGMLPIQSVCCSVVHESVLSNYAKLFADREAYNDGSLSRTNFLFIDPMIHGENKNRRSGTAKVDADMLIVMKLIADKYLNEGDPIHKHTGQAKMIMIEADDDCLDFLDSLEDEYILQKNRATREQDEVAISLYARKIVHIKQTCKILAISENPIVPRVTMEMVRWAVLRSDLLSSNMTYHASSGGLSGGMSQLVIGAMDWCRRYLNGRTKNKATRLEVKLGCIHSKIFRRSFFDAQKRIIAIVQQDPAYRYKTNSELFAGLLDELEATSRIEKLSNKNVFGVKYASTKSARDFKVLFSLTAHKKEKEKDKD